LIGDHGDRDDLGLARIEKATTERAQAEEIGRFGWIERVLLCVQMIHSKPQDTPATLVDEPELCQHRTARVVGVSRQRKRDPHLGFAYREQQNDDRKAD